MESFFEILEGAFISELNLLFNLGILHHDEAPMLSIATARRADSRLQDFTDEFIGAGSGFSRRIARIVRIASNRLIFRSIWTSSFLRRYWLLTSV